jgi:TIR domain
MSTSPTCFVSYSWDSKGHTAWVRRLAEALAANGVIVHLDVWDTRLGSNLPQYMETSIRDSKYVLLVCTPRYAERADQRKGGVGYETGIVTGEIFAKESGTTKFIPLLRGKDPAKSLPSYLHGKKYLDVRSSRRLTVYLKELLHELWEQPLYPKPTVGLPPDFTKPVLPNRPLAKSSLPKKVAKARRTQDIDKAIKDREQQLASLMKSFHPPALGRSLQGMRLAGDRADAISRLSSELDDLRKQKNLKEDKKKGK